MHPFVSATLEVAERVIPLIRPRFYNRITWVVVLGGILLVAAPWWSDLVNALAQKYLSVSVPSTSNNIGWGVLLVAIGLCYHVVVHSLNELVVAQRQAAVGAVHADHDKQLFSRFQQVLAEQELLDILQDIGNLHMYWSPQSSKLSMARHFLDAPSSQFLTEQVRVAALNFTVQLSKLSNFLGRHFFEYNSPETGDLRFCMYPDLNLDRARRLPTVEEQQQYDTFADELNAVVDDVEGGYKAFRQAVKFRLAI
jgi:hypothetical protein